MPLRMKVLVSRHRWVLWAAGVALLFALGAWFVGALASRDVASAQVSRGRYIYMQGADQNSPLLARIANQPDVLPAVAVRCINCHDRAGSAAEYRAQVLSREALLGVVPRRGGPATRFDAASLCKLLATGVDPAWILINQTMPRYELTDAQCRALWAYLESAES